MNIFLIFFVIKVLGQDCTNITVNKTMLNIYPTEGFTYIDRLSNYFSGDALTFETNNSIFSVTQYVNLEKYLDYSLNGDIIDIASQTNPQDSSDQLGNYATLVLSKNNYIVYQNNQQYGQEISSSSVYNCYDIAYVFTDQIIVSCTYNENQIFLYYLHGIPMPLVTFNQITQNDIIFTYLDTIQLNNGTTQINVIYTNPFSSTYAKYSIEQINNQLPKLKTITYQTYDYTIIGFYSSSDGSYMYLTNSTFYYVDVDLISHELVSKVACYGFGVYQNYDVAGHYLYDIALLTNNGVTNIHINYLSKVLFTINLEMALPYYYNLNYPFQILLNQYYVIISNTEQIAIYSGMNNTIIPNQLLGVLNQTNNTIMLNNINSQLLVLYSKNQQLFTLNTANIQTKTARGSGTLLIYAIDYMGNNCSIHLNYTTITVDQINNPLPTNNSYSKPSDDYYPYKHIYPIGYQYYGNNLTYSLNQQNSTAYLQQIQIEYIQNKQNIIYSQLLKSPLQYNSYIQLIQYESTILNILFCKYQGCENSTKLQVTSNIINSQIGYFNDQEFYLAVQSQNSILQIYSVIYGLITKTPLAPTYNLNVSLIVPTMTINDFKFLAGNIMIITQSPQILLCYQMSAQLPLLYNISGNDFIPRALYVNQEIYGDLMFIDNQYNLIIAQSILDNYQIIQTINYKYSNYETDICIGLLRNGIYIAIANQTDSQMSFYYRNRFELIQDVDLQNGIFNYPIQCDYSTDQFYIQWNINDTNQLGIFRQANSINNQLAYSIPINSSIEYISVIEDSNNALDIIQIFNQSQIIEIQYFNETSILFIPQQMNTTNQTYSLQYTVIGNNTSYTTSENIKVVIPQAYIELTSYSLINSSINLTSENSYGLLTLKPDQYFNGFINTYNATVLEDMDTILVNVSQNVINPIHDSTFILSQFDCQAATTGIFIENMEPIAFIQNSTTVLFHIPLPAEIGYQILYQFKLSDMTLCPGLFIYQYNLVSICSDTIDTYFSYITPNNITYAQSYQYIMNTTQPNLKSIQFDSNNQFLVLHYENITQFYQFNIYNSEFVLYQYSQFNPPKLTNYSIINGNDSITNKNFSGIIAITDTNQLIAYWSDYQYQDNLNKSQINNQTINTANIIVSPFITNPIFNIYQIGESILNDIYFTIFFAAQTQQQGYIISVEFNYKNQQSVIAQSALNLTQYNDYQGIGMQVMGNLIVSEYYSNGQSFIGLYGVHMQDKQVISKTGNFICYQLFNAQLTNFIFTPNGTLFYQDNQGTLSALYVQDVLTIFIDFNQLQFGVADLRVHLTVTAINPYSSANSDLELYAYIYQGEEYNRPSSKGYIELGIGLLFFVIICGVLIYLFLQSLKPSSRYDL